jgi:hypothetical protein
MEDRWPLWLYVNLVQFLWNKKYLIFVLVSYLFWAVLRCLCGESTGLVEPKPQLVFSPWSSVSGVAPRFRFSAAAAGSIFRLPPDFHRAEFRRPVWSSCTVARLDLFTCAVHKSCRVQWFLLGMHRRLDSARQSEPTVFVLRGTSARSIRVCFTRSRFSPPARNFCFYAKSDVQPNSCVTLARFAWARFLSTGLDFGSLLRFYCLGFISSLARFARNPPSVVSITLLLVGSVRIEVNRRCLPLLCDRSRSAEGLILPLVFSLATESPDLRLAGY